MNRKNKIIVVLIACLSLLVSANARQRKVKSLINESKVIDMTYNFDSLTVYWPTAKSFNWEKDFWGMTASGYFYASASYGASEHGGTHIDSPIHFGQGKATTEQIPVTKLIGPAVVIDISASCDKNPDYLLTVADIKNWERRFGRITDNSIVLIRTGWGKYWPNRKLYLGSDTPGDTANLHFPGISKEAAEFLANERKVDGVGVDTASLDYGQSKDFQAHRVLCGVSIYGLENIANMGQLPPVGATLIALPMKIKGGTGGPTRIIAILP